jgi:hypothetical protein
VCGELAYAAVPRYRVPFARGADADVAAGPLAGTVAASCAVSERFPYAATLSYAAVLACGTEVAGAAALIPGTAAPGTAAGELA